MKITQLPFLTVVSILLAPATYAAVTIDLTGNNAYDGENLLLIPFIDGTNPAIISLMSTGGTFNSNFEDFGIGDDQIDGTSEIVTVTFNQHVLFNSIDFGGVSSDLTDGVGFTIAGSALNLFTGVNGFNGNTDIYTPVSPVALTVGQSITITGSSETASFDIQNLNVTIIPEHRTFGLLAGIFALGLAMLRRNGI